ncbi:MAG: hypothetical protein AMJ92_11650 [candidate division Zixibacteria bacterium SM23_81]|nr:MAG: hypothetical protein AMJ92_11650 [candidate division Zixibacteria bacterium SM23_81]
MKTEFYIGFVIFALLLFLPLTVIASGKLARGVVPGELYVYGVGGTYPAAPRWLYRSTDYGQTVYFQNETGVGLFGEGVVEGEVYKYAGGEIYYSNDYGINFALKSIVGTDLDAIASGYAPGEVYTSIYDITKYSTDYGETFIDKGTCPGWVASMSVGHSAGEIYCGCHSGDIYHSTDYGETYELIIDMSGGYTIYNLTKGNEPGELYILANYMTLFYSQNYGDTLCQQYSFDDDFQTGLAGGFISGEVYVLEDCYDMFGKEDLYIHRSLDYGQTFTASHVYSNHMDVLLPEAIDNLTCAPSDSSILLDWWPVNQDIWGQPETISHYVVYRSTEPYFVPTSGDSIGFCTDSSYSDINSRWATPAYYYVVKAVDDSGNKSKASNRTGRFNRELTNCD